MVAAAAGPEATLITAEDRRRTMARLDRLARVMDTAFTVPGTGIRFGADAMVGLVPVVGDGITAVVALYLVSEARRLGAPGHLIGRMLANVAIDAVVGSVPVVGDLFDVAWRANRRNHALLRDWINDLD